MTDRPTPSNPAPGARLSDTTVLRLAALATLAVTVAVGSWAIGTVGSAYLDRQAADDQREAQRLEYRTEWVRSTQQLAGLCEQNPDASPDECLDYVLDRLAGAGADAP